ncbi:MAG: peptidyl-alpha-hydroxyglycine alpha-amidating lyase family protein [Rhodospirillaceae bacterium]|nr:peptidyl-alpha-hydroxyglycine alpha-amidating lyase family protein [Rhodospirillaceae bacterium]
MTPIRVLTCLALVLAAALAQTAQGQLDERSWRMTEDWAQLPEGVIWGQIISLEVDEQGNLYAFHRCSANTCIDRTEPPLLKFDPTGNLLMTWGEGLLVWPHGLHLDAQGNIWLTDGESHEGRGDQVFKLSPEGEVLMTIGTAGVTGDGPHTFNGAADVIVAGDGSIFVADGHINNRIVKYSPEGEYLLEWGEAGAGPGEFDTPHALAMDSRGRLFVADRGNLRVQIFDQQGNFLDEWKQFGRPSGVTITADDRIYVASQNGENSELNPGYETGIYVGDARDGSVTGFIGGIDTENAAEGPGGIVYSGLVIDRMLRRYEPEQP